MTEWVIGPGGGAIAPGGRKLACEPGRRRGRARGARFAFVLACIGNAVLPKLRPQAPRPFRAPFTPLVPILGAGICRVEMVARSGDLGLRRVIWVALGVAIYFG